METSGSEGGCHRRGRPRMNRSIEGVPSARCYAPQCSPNKHEEIVSLLPEELAVLDLIDLQGLEQEQAATVLGVSRKTIWRDIHEARRKITDALIHGKALEIGGCLRRQKGICRRASGINNISLTGSAVDQLPDDPGAE
ncbi:MAG: DUF134 domain-containing protein [Methanoregula sp.]|nr:DUF134 domain-containing protein [Methanoregula sp.]